MLLRTHYRILIECPITLNSPYFGGGGTFSILVYLISLTGQIFTTNYVPSIFSGILAIYIIGISKSPYFLYQVFNMIRTLTFSL